MKIKEKIARSSYYRADFIGAIPDIQPGEDTSGYRSVPSTDRGNADYSDRGMLGSYSTDQEAFRDPAGVRHFTGYGATEADLDRGYQMPSIRDNPAYDLENYKDRSSQPSQPDLSPGDVEAMRDDYAFRRENLRSRGFLTRPRPPTDR